ncbi:MAG: hypothetical protein ABMB14_15340 [Myxococcota bacterium]
MRVAWLVVIGCSRGTAPTVEAPVPPNPAGPWGCRAYVARAEVAAPVTAVGTGVDEPAAEADAWTRACAALPPSDPPGCKPGAPPDGWTWAQEVTPVDGGLSVALTFTSAPVPFRGEGDSTVSRDDACAAAYAAACRAAGADADCRGDSAYVDRGIDAVEE